MIVNTGMGFEGPLHRRAYDAVDASPVRAVILTQGHYDHVGGIDVVRDPDSEVIAQANFTMWRDDNERLEAFRSRNSAFAFIDAISRRMEYARVASASAHVAQARPEPTMTVDDRLELTIGGRRFELIADARRGDVRLDGRLAARGTDPALRQPLRPAVRPRAQPGHDPRRPLPRCPHLHRVARRACSTWPPSV